MWYLNRRGFQPTLLSIFRQYCFLLLLSAVAFGEWQSIGNLKPMGRKGNEFTFGNDRATVVVQILAPDIVRVRAVAATILPPDHSYAVVKTDWPAVKVDSSSTATYQSLRTEQLEVRVQLAPCRVAFYDAKGQLLSKDTDNHGISWDGRRVRVWKVEPADEHYFGFGEKSTPLDKRGRSLVMWNRDPEGFDASSEPLYESVPFFIALRKGRAYGIFFDNTWRSSFDMGSDLPDLYSFGAEGGEMNYYFFAGPTPKQVVSRFTELVGRIPLPPRWSLGYVQSRYSYYPESRVRFIAQNFRERSIPCDAIFLDIDFMDAYRVFTWDKSRFPDPKHMMTDLRQQGFRTIAIVDPMVKADPNYWVYKQGLQNDYFVKKADGTVFIGKGWADANAYPDFASPQVRDWWAGLFQQQLEQGVAGYLTDMNEPTVIGGDGPATTFDMDAVHHTEMGPRPHAEIHNVYGMLETLATRDGMLRVRPNERPFIITRATFAGGQRYAAQWSGDNHGTWDQLQLSMPMLNGMGLSGLQFVGADIGGIVPVPSPELYTRWMQAGLLTPFAWTHSLGPGNLEPWGFGNRMEGINRESIKLRYRLLPYIYTAFWEASQTGQPIMRPLLLEYPDDPLAVGTNDEYFLGNDLLVAPIVKDYDESRSVYLPKGTWYDYWSDRKYVGPGNVNVNAPLDRIPLFVRGGAIIPSQQDMQYTDQHPIDPLTFDFYPAGPSSRQYYDDDGISSGYQKGLYYLQTVSVEPRPEGVSIDISSPEGSFRPPKRSLVLRIHLQANPPRTVAVGATQIPQQASDKALQDATKGWLYDAESRTIRVKFRDEQTASSVVVSQ
jgi:alpha-glucosidase